jgi:putative Holliday junction resolvase
MRVLGLDYGSRTVGVAISDPTGLIAQPLKTITRERESMLRKTLAEIQEIVREYEVDRIVLGLPFNMDDTEGERARKTREFREKLSLRTEVPIIFMDERLTTVAAQEILDDSGIPRSEQKKVIDQVAAGLILQTYLDDVQNGKRS